LADTDQNNNTNVGSKLTAATTASAGQLARRRISPLHGLASLVPGRALGTRGEQLVAGREQSVVAGTPPPPPPATIRRGENCTKPTKAAAVVRRVPSITITNVGRRPRPVYGWTFSDRRDRSAGRNLRQKRGRGWHELALLLLLLIDVNIL